MQNILIAMHEPVAAIYFDRLWNATAEETEKAQAIFGERADAPPKIFSVQDRVGVINIQGPLSKKGPSALALFFGFGGTGYMAITEAVAEFKKMAEAGELERVDVLMDTPGGEVDGVDLAYQALADLAAIVDLRVMSTGMIASAGYYLASAASRIEAQSPTDMIGSIGVKIAGMDFTELYEKHGVKRRVIISGNAPKKDRTLATEQGREVLQGEVDALERVFYMRIAQGRGISAETIREKFGQGGILVAFDPGKEKPDALNAGMIDGLTTDNVVPLSELSGEREDSPEALGDGSAKISAANPQRVGCHSKEGQSKQNRGRGSANSQETQTMSLKQFLAENPEARAEYDKALATAKDTGRAEGVAEGKQQAEADAKLRGERVSAILGAEKTYGPAVQAHCMKVLKGEADTASLDTLVATVDAVREEQAGSAAAGETAETGATGGDTQVPAKAEGVAETEADFQAQLQEAKALGGAK